MVIFSAGHEIRKYFAEAKTFEYSDVVLAGWRVQAIDVDPQRKLLYWTDSSLKAIKRAVIPDDVNQMGHPQDLAISGLREPNGIAFDWIAK